MLLKSMAPWILFQGNSWQVDEKDLKISRITKAYLIQTHMVLCIQYIRVKVGSVWHYEQNPWPGHMLINDVSTFLAGLELAILPGLLLIHDPQPPPRTSLLLPSICVSDFWLDLLRCQALLCYNLKQTKHCVRWLELTLHNSCSKHSRLCKLERFSNLPPSPNSTGCLNQAIYLGWLQTSVRNPLAHYSGWGWQTLCCQGWSVGSLKPGPDDEISTCALVYHLPSSSPPGPLPTTSSRPSFKALPSCTHLSPPTHTKYPKQADHLSGADISEMLTTQQLLKKPLVCLLSFHSLPCPGLSLLHLSSSFSLCLPLLALQATSSLCLQSGSIPGREGGTGCRRSIALA